MIGPTIETARLMLRPPIHADFDGFAEMAQEEETMRFIGGVAARDAAWRTMAMVTGAWALLGYSMFSVIEKSSGQWIGRLGPWRPGGKEGSWPGDEVGWALRASAQGKGYAAEGASRRHRLGLRRARLGERDPLHRPGQRPVNRARRASRLLQATLRGAARRALRGRARRHLRADESRVAQPQALKEGRFTCPFRSREIRPGRCRAGGGTGECGRAATATARAAPPDLRRQARAPGRGRRGATRQSG